MDVGWPAVAEAGETVRWSWSITHILPLLPPPITASDRAISQSGSIQPTITQSDLSVREHSADDHSERSLSQGAFNRRSLRAISQSGSIQPTITQSDLSVREHPADNHSASKCANGHLMGNHSASNITQSPPPGGIDRFRYCVIAAYSWSADNDSFTVTTWRDRRDSPWRHQEVRTVWFPRHVFFLLFNCSQYSCQKGKLYLLFLAFYRST